MRPRFESHSDFRGGNQIGRFMARFLGLRLSVGIYGLVLPVATPAGDIKQTAGGILDRLIYALVSLVAIYTLLQRMRSWVFAGNFRQIAL